MPRPLTAKKREQLFRRLLKVVNHPQGCRCRSRDCKVIQESQKEWAKAIKPMTEAIKASKRITSADLAVRINARPG